MRARRTALICFALAGLLLGACGDGADSTETADDAGTTTTAADAANDDATESATAATVQVSDHPDFGQILVGPNGHTLYLFERDQGTTTACTGGCASAWPALSAAGEPMAGDGVDASKLSTADGQVPNQVAYNGHLLYFFARDAQPGDVTGIDVPDWYPLNPAGDKVERGES